MPDYAAEDADTIRAAVLRRRLVELIAQNGLLEHELVPEVLYEAAGYRADDKRPAGVTVTGILNGY